MHACEGCAHSPAAAARCCATSPLSCLACHLAMACSAGMAGKQHVVPVRLTLCMRMRSCNPRRRAVHLLHHQDLRLAGVCHHHDHAPVRLHPPVVHPLCAPTHRRPRVRQRSSSRAACLPSARGARRNATRPVLLLEKPPACQRTRTRMHGRLLLQGSP